MAVAQGSSSTEHGWNYEVISPGQGEMLTRQHAMLNHNRMIDANGKVLVSTWQIGVLDYQLVSELPAPFQSACEVMQSGGRYRFHIPIDDFKAASRNGGSISLPGEEVIWEVEVKKILPPKPDVSRVVGKTFKTQGADQAFQEFQTLRSERSSQVYFGEWEVNQLGYLFLNQGRTAQAIEILKYNVQAYPSSANAHDSLGEAYLKSGNNQLAAVHYRRSLEINPKNQNAKKMLAKLNE